MMDALQDFFTTIAIFLEYLIFGYLAVAFLLFAFERQALENNRPASSNPSEPESFIAPPPEQGLVLVPVG